MTRAPAAAARNTKSAAEGEVIMTDDELEQTIKGVSEELDKLYNSEKPLTKQEKRHKQILSLQKATLLKMKEARAKKDTIKEGDLALTYGLLVTMGEKHPFLMTFLRTKFRWNVF